MDTKEALLQSCEQEHIAAALTSWRERKTTRVFMSLGPIPVGFLSKLSSGLP